MFQEPCCPACGENEHFETYAATIATTIEINEAGWDITEPNIDMDIASPTQKMKCLTCGHEGTATEFGFTPESENQTRPVRVKTLSVHGNVSLMYCMAMRFAMPDNARLALPYRQAGYTAHQLVLVTLEPNHGMRAFYSAYDANEFDCDLGDAYAWLDTHFDEIPDDGYLLDLPYVRGTVAEPTTTFEREYIEPWL